MEIKTAQTEAQTAQTDTGNFTIFRRLAEVDSKRSRHRGGFDFDYQKGARRRILIDVIANLLQHGPVTRTKLVKQAQERSANPPGQILAAIDELLRVGVVENFVNESGDGTCRLREVGE